MSRFALRWQRREPPLSPKAVLAHDQVADKLTQQLLDRGFEGLRALATEHSLLLIGDTLPWVDGVHYLAPDPACPELWMGTTTEPKHAATLVLQALRHHLDLTGPLAVHDGRVYPLSTARKLDAEALNSWLLT